jgi:Zn-dependent peptidase ImmA (M78 family)
MNVDDYVVDARSSKDIEAVSLAWRDALGIRDDWAPDIVDLIEFKLPRLVRAFALVIRRDGEMDDAEAFTEFQPPRIVIRESVYRTALNGHGRSRMTLAHELGHLVMHPGAAKPRASMAIAPKNTPLYRSAEWQARKFASLFLLPTHVVIQFGSVGEIVQCCKVSQQAAQIRFQEVSRLKTPKRPPPCIEDFVKRFS